MFEFLTAHPHETFLTLTVVGMVTYFVIVIWCLDDAIDAFGIFGDAICSLLRGKEN